MDLFICNQGENRSKTAAEILGGNYAGIYSENNPVTKEKLVEAETIFVFEDEQRKWMGKNFPEEYLKKRIINLDIPDTYYYQQKELVRLLKKLK